MSAGGVSPRKFIPYGKIIKLLFVAGEVYSNSKFEYFIVAYIKHYKRFGYITEYQESLPQNNTKYIKSVLSFSQKGQNMKLRHMCQTQSNEYRLCHHGKIINLFSVAHKVWMSPVHDDISLCNLEECFDNVTWEKNFETYFGCRY